MVTAAGLILEQLIKLDDTVSDLLVVIKEFPIKTTVLTEKLQAETDKMQAEETKFRDKQKDLHSTELLASEKEQLVQKLETQLNTVKKNDEYALLKTQIKDTGEEISKLEDAILGKYDDIEVAQAQLDTVHSEFSQFKKETNTTLKDLSESHQYATERLAHYNKEKASVIEEMDMDLAKKYQRLFDHFQTQVVVPIEEQLCQGCFMKVTPETLSRVHGGGIETCYNCGRILYGVRGL